MNDFKSILVWGIGIFKVGEMIVKYIDMLLCGGFKIFFKFLLLDNKDKVIVERSGFVVVGDEDFELDI